MEFRQPSGIESAQLAPVNAAQARAFLTKRFRTDIRDVAGVSRGEWSRAFTCSHAGKGYVIRCSAHQEDFAKDRWAARFDSAALPIPRIIETGEAYSGFYAISERAHGRFLDTLDAVEMPQMLPALFKRTELLWA